MSATLIMAAVLAGLAASFLGLVDAGREIDASLSRMEREALALHRATTDSVEHGASADAITRPRTSLRRMIDAFASNADRIVADTAQPYTRGISRSIADVFGLVPRTDEINRAYGDYLEQTKQAQADAGRSGSGADLSARLLDLNHEVLIQRIGDARDRARQAVGSALNGLQVITFLSIGIAALAVGLSGDRS
jgi:hypothetical protein